MMEEQSTQYYLVENTTDKEILRDWSLNLLNEDQKKSWEQYKKTPEYLGYDKKDAAIKNRMPVSVRLKQWANKNQMGVSYYHVHSIRPEGETNWMFALKPGKNVLTEEQVASFRSMEIREIEQKIKYGQTKPDIVIEGYLKITPITEDKAMQIIEELKEVDNKPSTLGLKEAELEERERILSEREEKLKLQEEEYNAASKEPTKKGSKK